ncbi:MAG: TerC family protein [Gemmatimonadota bacterium]|nr:TerC family protein [Gemmatimonadota bacterium]
MIHSPLLPWIAFNAVVLVALAIDLGLGSSGGKLSVRQAAVRSAVWVFLALLFAAGIFYFRGHAAGVEFITGYLVEYSLSVDNIFVMVLIFSYFEVREEYQHRVLFWGILGALVMRGLMIAAGAALFGRFEWITYVFGIFLVVTGVRMGMSDGKHVDPAANPVLRLVRRIIPVHDAYDGERFFIRAPDSAGAERLMATPLLVVLILIETMDLVFAVDSIPAVFAVTRVPFLVYTSNVAAILGLRSLYFLLAGAVGKLRYLTIGLAFILAFVGVKMLASAWFEVPALASLCVIVLVLGAAAVASVYVDRKELA